MAGFGQSDTEIPRGFCISCFTRMEGTGTGIIKAIGFGGIDRKGSVAICMNPKCAEGQKNRAKQQIA